MWPAFGISVAAFLAYGYRVWPAIAASAFVIAGQGAVPVLASAGQAIGRHDWGGRQHGPPPSYSRVRPGIVALA